MEQMLGRAGPVTDMTSAEADKAEVFEYQEGGSILKRKKTQSLTFGNPIRRTKNLVVPQL